MMGIYNGFPPTPPSVQEEMGLGDMPNVNTKQFQAKCDTYADNWNAVNCAGTEWFEVKAKHDDPMEAERRSKYLTTCFNEAIKKWDGTGFENGSDYIIWSAVRDKQMGIFGIGVSYFCDPIDFRWRCIPTRKVLVPEGTNLTLDNCTAVFIEDDISVTDLYAKRKMPGWNEKAILYILYNRLNQSRTGQRSDTYSQWVERVRENDQFIDSDFSPVRFVHVYAKEFGGNLNEGKITHCIICEQFGSQSGDTNTTKKDDLELEASQGWVYEKENVAERWSQILSVFSDNAGLEGKWWGVKGFGDLIFDGCHFNNLMFNRTATSAIVANTPMFNSSQEGDRQKLNQVKITPFGILQPGLTLETTRVNVDINSAMEMFNLGTNIINSNSRQFPQNQQTVGGEAPTATQVNYDRADEARFTNLQISFYRATGLDNLGAEMYRRLAQPESKYPESWPGGKIAAAFRKKAKEYGISEGDLLKVKTVRASRNIGSGNMGLDVMRADQALSVATPGQGQLNARKLKVQALYGADMVPALVQEEKPEANYEDVQISNENLNIQSGQTPEAFGSQPHQQHLMGGATQGHIPLLAEVEQIANQMLEAGLDKDVAAAEKILGVLISGLEHSKQHVAFMSELPRTRGRLGLFEGEVKEFNKVLNDLEQFTQSFQEALESAQEAANPQQGMSPEMMKAQADIEMKREMHQLDMQIKQAQAITKAENDKIKGTAKLENAQAAFEQNLGQKAQEAVLNQQVSEAQAQLEVEGQAIKTGLDIVKTQQEARAKQQAASTNGSSE